MRPGRVRALLGRLGAARSAARLAHPPAGTRPAGSGLRSQRGLLRSGGRIVLWVLLVVVLVRGVGDILSGSARPPGAPWGVAARRSFPGSEAAAFAVGFARAYLTWRPGEPERHARAVGDFLASGLRDRAAALLPRRGPGERVAQATVARESNLGGARALVTVVCFLADGNTRYLTVPVARDPGGRVVVFDLPALSAPTPIADAAAAEPQPLTGEQAGSMSDVVRRFLAAYLGGGGPHDLTSFLAPGASVASMPTGLELVSIGQVGQSGKATAARVPVAALVRVHDRGSGAIYSLRYRLELVRRERWYVAAVGGAA